MPKTRFTIEQIINHLREAEVLLARGGTVGGLCRRIGVLEQPDSVRAVLGGSRIAVSQRGLQGA